VSPRFLVMGLPDQFVTHGETKKLFEELGLDAASVRDRILQILGGKA